MPRVQTAHRSRLIAVLERLQVQTLVTQATVEPLVAAVLPWAARLNALHLHLLLGQHLHQPLGDELRPVVTPHVLWPPTTCANSFSNVRITKLAGIRRST